MPIFRVLQQTHCRMQYQNWQGRAAASKLCNKVGNMLLSIQNVTKYFLDQCVLQDISLDINEGDRLGLLGVNGAGKTTLLNIIAGKLDADEGTIGRAKDLSIGYLRQNDALDTQNTLMQEARDALKQTFAVQAELESCSRHLAANPADTQLLAEYDRLTARFEALDGYRAEDKINRVFNGLGFDALQRQVRVATLSGGEKMRFAIAKMLLREPDLLILDEPTNHLDFSMLGWLEKYLATYKGAVLVVSHDRYFLDTVAKDICEIERGRLTRYKGGYASFVVQKNERYLVALRAWEKQQEEIQKLEEFVRKNLAKSASVNGVGSRVKKLEKMERLEKPQILNKTIHLKFSYDIEPFTRVLLCKGLGVYVGNAETGRQLFHDVDLEVQRGEKVALVGHNGVGKSTFLRAIQALIPHQGAAQWGGNVRIAYFDQELAALNMEETALEAVHSQYPSRTEFEIRSALGKMLLEGEDVYKRVRELSGANRAKVAFTILQMRRANVLVLDEPTNHLDYRAKEQLEEALRLYTGTLIVVSHDRYFLRMVPDRILEMREDGFTIFNGNYDYYLEKTQQLAQQRAAEAQAEKERLALASSQSTYRSKQQRAADAQKRTQIKALEKEIATLEQQIEEINAALANPANGSNYPMLAELSQQLQQASTSLEDTMLQWLLLTEENT